MCWSITASSVIAEESSVPDGPWISAVAWQGDAELLGARSQGLLFRSAEVVRASAQTPNDMAVVGTSDTSLWSVLPVSGDRVVATDYKGGMKLFDSSKQPAEKSPDGSTSFTLDARWIRALQHSPAPGEILAGTEDGKLLVLSIEEAKELRRVDAHAAAIFDIAVSSAGDKIATASGDGFIKLFSWPQLEPLGEMHVDKDAIWSLLFVNNDQQIVSGGANRAIQLWDVATASSVVTIAMAHNWITSLAALPESNLVVAGCMDGNLVVADFSIMQAVHTQAGPGSAIWSIALAPDGKQLAIGTRKHGMAVVDTQPWLAVAQAAAEAAHANRPPAPKKK